MIVHVTFARPALATGTIFERAVGLAAQLIRHTTAMHMVYNMLPSGPFGDLYAGR